MIRCLEAKDSLLAGLLGRAILRTPAVTVYDVPKAVLATSGCARRTFEGLHGDGGGP
jgi:hypothetical protein